MVTKTPEQMTFCRRSQQIEETVLNGEFAELVDSEDVIRSLEEQNE